MRRLGPLACLLILAACGGRSGRDAGTDDTGSAVDGGGADTPAIDAPGSDTPTTGDTGSGSDAGPCDPRPGSPPLPPPDACAAATGTCMMMAVTLADQERCFMMDPDPMGCVACLTAETQSSCSRGMGTCADEYGPLRCCLEAECPGLPPACVAAAQATGGECFSVYATFNMCVRTNLEMRPPLCGITATHCFR